MHELAICRSLIDQLQTIASERNARRVLSVVVRVGPLAGVEAQLLRRAYSLASAGTVAEGSNLMLESSPVRVRCTECGIESEVESNRLVCPCCGNWQTDLVTGDELLLASVELQRSVSTATTA